MRMVSGWMRRTSWSSARPVPSGSAVSATTTSIGSRATMARASLRQETSKRRWASWSRLLWNASALRASPATISTVRLEMAMRMVSSVPSRCMRSSGGPGGTGRAMPAGSSVPLRVHSWDLGCAGPCDAIGGGAMPEPRMRESPVAESRTPTVVYVDPDRAQLRLFEAQFGDRFRLTLSSSAAGAARPGARRGARGGAARRSRIRGASCSRRARRPRRHRAAPGGP